MTSNTNNLKNKVEIVVNIIIAVAVVVVAGIALKSYLFQGGGEKRPSEQIVAGARMNVPGVNWEENKKTLAFFMKKDCPYCTSSATFYRQLTEEATKRGVKLLAVVPHSAEEGREYLNSIGLPIENVRSGTLANYKIPGTPTVMLLDHTGTVVSVWVGGVPPEREREIWEGLVPFFDAEISRPASAARPAGGAAAPAVAVPEAIDARELKALLEAKQNVTVIDVDEREEYRKEHIPGAKNLPSDEFYARADREIPKDGRVVLYCRCAGYGASGGARTELVKQGHTQVSVLKDGLSGWKEIGMPTTASN